jgi:hypothetical protein
VGWDFSARADERQYGGTAAVLAMIRLFSGLGRLIRGDNRALLFEVKGASLRFHRSRA